VLQNVVVELLQTVHGRLHLDTQAEVLGYQTESSARYLRVRRLSSPFEAALGSWHVTLVGEFPVDGKVPVNLEPVFVAYFIGAKQLGE
jgi:1,2-phenylacetyl-CoA epoxidase catalytic subunit